MPKNKLTEHALVAFANPRFLRCKWNPNEHTVGTQCVYLSQHNFESILEKHDSREKIFKKPEMQKKKESFRIDHH